MPTTLVNTVRSTLEPSDNPYLGGAWRPTFNEWNGVFANGDAQVIGTIPSDIEGVYIRSGENQIHQPIGRYHPFDGDGLLHAVSFKHGRAAYRSRFVRTAGFEAEAAAGRAVWAGLWSRRAARPAPAGELRGRSRTPPRPTLPFTPGR